MTLYIFVSVQSWASATLAVIIDCLIYSLYVLWISILLPSDLFDSLLNSITHNVTCIWDDSFGLKCFLWPCLHVNSATFIFAVSWCTALQLTHSMLLLYFFHILQWPDWSDIEFPLCIGHPQTRFNRLRNPPQPGGSVLRSRSHEDPWHQCAVWNPHFNWMSLNRITLNENFYYPFWKIALYLLNKVYSLWLAFHRINRLFSTIVGNAALISIRSTPVQLLFIHAVCILPMIMVGISMAAYPFLLPDCYKGAYACARLHRLT